MDKYIINAISLIKTSGHRRKILKSLSNARYLTPSEISSKTKIRMNHVSSLLRALKESKLVTCLNDNEKRGRLYKITTLGKRVFKENEN